MLTILTPTCDQPIGMALAETYMARQTYQGPRQWIVVDDGIEPAVLTQGQEHILRRREEPCTGAQSLCGNLLAGLDRVVGDAVVIAEHDDWYASTHLETIARQLAADDVVIAGDDQQRYYNVQHRVWRCFQNVGASLCQTAFHRSLIPEFRQVVTRCLNQNKYGVDRLFWSRVPHGRSLERTVTVIGIKGLPGRLGLGIGHRPSGPGWNRDPKAETLRAWMGADAEWYVPFGERAA